MTVQERPMRQRHDVFPPPAIYEMEFTYWPWGLLLRRIEAWVAENATPDSAILDYMCGTAFLLNEISMKRRGLRFYGCSITPDFISYAKKHYQSIHVELEDALEYEPPERPDVVICTGGIHHLRDDRKAQFVEKAHRELCDGGYFLVGEEVLREFEDSESRKAAVYELSSSMMLYALRRRAPLAVLDSIAKLQVADLHEDGEYKTSLNTLTNLLESFFEIISIEQVWPVDDKHYGNVFITCKKISRHEL